MSISSQVEQLLIDAAKTGSKAFKYKGMALSSFARTTVKAGEEIISHSGDDLVKVVNGVPKVLNHDAVLSIRAASGSYVVFGAGMSKGLKVSEEMAQELLTQAGERGLVTSFTNGTKTTVRHGKEVIAGHGFDEAEKLRQAAAAYANRGVAKKSWDFVTTIFGNRLSSRHTYLAYKAHPETLVPSLTNLLSMAEKGDKKAITYLESMVDRASQLKYKNPITADQLAEIRNRPGLANYKVNGERIEDIFEKLNNDITRGAKQMNGASLKAYHYASVVRHPLDTAGRGLEAVGDMFRAIPGKIVDFPFKHPFWAIGGGYAAVRTYQSYSSDDDLHENVARGTDQALDDAVSTGKFGVRMTLKAGHALSTVWPWAGAALIALAYKAEPAAEAALRTGSAVATGAFSGAERQLEKRGMGDVYIPSPFLKGTAGKAVAAAHNVRSHMHPSSVAGRADRWLTNGFVKAAVDVAEAEKQKLSPLDMLGKRFELAIFALLNTMLGGLLSAISGEKSPVSAPVAQRVAQSDQHALNTNDGIKSKHDLGLAATAAFAPGQVLVQTQKPEAVSATARSIAASANDEAVSTFKPSLDMQRHSLGELANSIMAGTTNFVRERAAEVGTGLDTVLDVAAPAPRGMHA